MKSVLKRSFIFEAEDKKELRLRLIDNGLSMYILAKRLNVSQSYLSQIVNGKKSVSEKFIDKLDKALGYNA